MNAETTEGIRELGASNEDSIKEPASGQGTNEEVPQKKPLRKLNRWTSDSSSSSDSTSSSDTSERPAKQVPRQPVSNTCTASSSRPPEDEFDLAILSLAGPWLKPGSKASPARTQQNPPAKFNSIQDYLSTIQPLIIEECKAIMMTTWEDVWMNNGKSTGDGKKENNPEKMLSCNLSVFYPAAGESFCYLEVNKPIGSRIFLDIGQVVLVRHGGITKAVAIVNSLIKASAILRTNARCDIVNGQYDLYKLDNLTTAKRTYVSMSNLSTFSNSLKQQILNPSVNFEFVSWLRDREQCEMEITKWSSWMSHANFNRQQMLAIIAVLRLQQGFFLVQGPPGTGKTTTIIGMVSALLNENAQTRILVCAPSNAALDEVGVRLMKGMYDKDGNINVPLKGSVVRIGPKANINNACLGITVEGILSGRTQLSSWQDAEKDVVRAASVVCTTLSCCGHWLMDELNLTFDLVIIDEAVQAVEAEVLIALARAKSRCVLIGDPCQLPATVFQQPASAYARSLFERMQEAGFIPHFLDIQYRMHRSISYFPSRQFYGGALKDSLQVLAMNSVFTDEALGQGVNSEGYYFKPGHYCFLNLKCGIDEMDDKGRSRFNDSEAKAVASVVRGILRNLRDEISKQKLEMGIVTPYASQKFVIWKYLTESERSSCEINTIDGFQGREKDIIIVSCVRAQQGKGLGFVSDKRRMNVALTRAKHSLVVIGHAEALQYESRTWRALIEDARSRGLYQVLSRQGTEQKPLQARVPMRQENSKCHKRNQNGAQSEERNCLASKAQGVEAGPSADHRDMLVNQKHFGKSKQRSEPQHGGPCFENSKQASIRHKLKQRGSFELAQPEERHCVTEAAARAEAGSLLNSPETCPRFENWEKCHKRKRNGTAKSSEAGVESVAEASSSVSLLVDHPKPRKPAKHRGLASSMLYFGSSTRFYCQASKATLKRRALRKKKKKTIADDSATRTLSLVADRWVSVENLSQFPVNSSSVETDLDRILGLKTRTLHI